MLTCGKDTDRSVVFEYKGQSAQNKIYMYVGMYVHNNLKSAVA